MWVLFEETRLLNSMTAEFFELLVLLDSENKMENLVISLNKVQKLN